MGAPADHIALTPEEIQWSPGPPSLPAGVQMAVIEGDPTAEGPFTFRLKVPDGYRVPPHMHPNLEHVTVISGTVGIGIGETFDPVKGKESGPGGFYVMQPGTAHYAWAKGEAVVQIHSIGPWGITYVNPADDPRNQGAAGR